MSHTAIALSKQTAQAYDDAGVGDPALLCLPGWCGVRSEFDAFTALTTTRRRTLALDLPEHGTRPHTGADFDTADVVADAIALLDERGVERVVPVVLSHVAWVAIALRDKLGAERVPGVVLLDWTVFGPPPGFVEALAGLEHPTAGSNVHSGLLAAWTGAVDVPAMRRRVAIMGGGDPLWRHAGREIANSLATEGTPLTALERRPEPCPTLHVYAQPTDDAVLAVQRDYAATHPWFRAHRLAARSPFPLFETPDETATVIEEFTCALH